ncbi:MAG TPA: NlpC/P60 family protein [Alphaproteobacteria bacterium]
MSEKPSFDPRLTLARADLAADHLEGIVKADAYKAPERWRVSAPLVNLYKAPVTSDMLSTTLESQWLYGEDIDVLEIKDGWAWGQSLADGYVGYCRAEHLVRPTIETTHRVSNLMTHAYNSPDVKTTPLFPLSYGSEVTVIDETDGFMRTDADLFIPSAHLVDKFVHALEPVSEAFRFLGVPYVYGGRSGFGIDCSALIQLCLQACGMPFPRDMDMQAAVKAQNIARAALQTGDLVFFAHDDGKQNHDGSAIHGHLGIMVDDTMMIHANEMMMATSMDDLDDYLAMRGRTGKTTRHHCIRLKG